MMPFWVIALPVSAIALGAALGSIVFDADMEEIYGRARWARMKAERRAERLPEWEERRVDERGRYSTRGHWERRRWGSDGPWERFDPNPSA